MIPKVIVNSFTAEEVGETTRIAICPKTEYFIQESSKYQSGALRMYHKIYTSHVEILYIFIYLKGCMRHWI